MKTLQNFPEAFYPLVVITGDRRDDPPKSRGDLFAYSMSPCDLMFFPSLKLREDVQIKSDKIFVLMDDSYLKREFGKTNLLIIGSPATNLVARKVNRMSLFRFNISKNSEEKLRSQEKIIEKAPFDIVRLHIYLDVVRGVPLEISLENLKTRRFLVVDEENFRATYESVVRDYASTKIGNFKSLIREFTIPGLIDPIDNALHGIAIGYANDFGLISIARNPFADNEDYVSIFVAGIHGPGTAQALRILGNSKNFESCPYGGIFEVQLNPALEWPARFESALQQWQTRTHYTSESVVRILREHLAQDGPGYLTKEEKIACIDFLVNLTRKPKENPKRIFLSVPLDIQKNESKEENAKLKKSVFECLKKIDPKIPKLKEILVNGFDIPKGPQPFRDALFNALANAHLVLHEISTQAAGVMFEIGWSIGLSKRYFLVWNQDPTPFSPAMLPSILKGQEVITYSLSNKELKKDFRSRILEPFWLETDTKNMDVPDNTGMPNHFVYIDFNSDFQEQYDFLVETLAGYGLYPIKDEQIPMKYSSIDDRLLKTFMKIRLANLCFIDISNGKLGKIRSESLIKLGIADAISHSRGIRHTMALYNSASTSELSMWQGLPQCQWTKANFKRIMKEEVDGFLKRVLKGRA